MFKTKDEITKETGYSFEDGASKTQYFGKVRYRLNDRVLFKSETLLGEWDMYAKINDLDFPLNKGDESNGTL